ncbi:cytochrome P450 [Ramlibacter terrae]|uniref:Cytochrome P450 n=1 Tax=Ramlibacter terrae TaxID=2732511 RepID=A0ABX6P120_9BURK|nr:cytochrome P450 [Ramlibacter terrae]
MPTPLNRSLARTREVLDGYLRPIIRARRAQPEPRDDILESLLRVKDPETGDALSDRGDLDETKTLFTAGFETTATALTWAMFLLARHPEAMAKLIAEIDTVLAGRPPGWEDLEKLPYTSQVVQETLRLYPPVYSLARECVEDDVLGGFTVPRGTVLMLSVLGIHRDARWWPQPEAFRPERFAGDWPRQAYLPFATGRHLCVGNHFSLTEMAVVLVRIAQRYRFTLADPGPVGMQAQITPVPDREIHLMLEPR